MISHTVIDGGMGAEHDASPQNTRVRATQASRSRSGKKVWDDESGGGRKRMTLNSERNVQMSAASYRMAATGGAGRHLPRLRLHTWTQVVQASSARAAVRRAGGCLLLFAIYDEHLVPARHDVSSQIPWVSARLCDIVKGLEETGHPLSVLDRFSQQHQPTNCAIGIGKVGLIQEFGAVEAEATAGGLPAGQVCNRSLRNFAGSSGPERT